MGHSAVEVYVHFVFATKNRQPLISLVIEERLHSYLCGIAKDKHSPVIKINGMEDHLHILLNLSSKVAICDLARELKAYSSGWMKKQGLADFGWQDGYGAFSYSKSHILDLSKYIENQKEHHKKHTFQDEIIRLQEIWGITWLSE